MPSSRGPLVASAKAPCPELEGDVMMQKLQQKLAEQYAGRACSAKKISDEINRRLDNTLRLLLPTPVGGKMRWWLADAGPLPSGSSGFQLGDRPEAEYKLGLVWVD